MSEKAYTRYLEHWGAEEIPDSGRPKMVRLLARRSQRPPIALQTQIQGKSR